MRDGGTASPTSAPGGARPRAWRRLRGRIAPALLGGAIALAGLDAAAVYPEKPIRLVIPASPGSFTDASARAVVTAVETHKLLPKPLVPVNLIGPAGSVGARQVRTAPADGYTLLISSIGLLGARASGAIDFGPESFEPVIAAGESCYVMVVRADASWKTLREAIEEAKRKPKTIAFGVAAGGPTHLAAALIERASESQFRLVDSGDTVQSLPQLVSGQIQMQVATAATFGRLGSGVRALAILDRERSPAFAELPTANEQGVGAELCLQNIFFLPKGTPRRTVTTVARALEKVVQTDTLRDAFRPGTFKPTVLRGRELQTRIERDGTLVDALAPRLRTLP